MRLVNAFVGGNETRIASADVYRKGTLIWLNTPGNRWQRRAVSPRLRGEYRAAGPIRTGIDRTTLDRTTQARVGLMPAAFTAAPAYTLLGNAAFYHNNFRQPAVFNEGVSIVKRTTLWQNEKNPGSSGLQGRRLQYFQSHEYFGGVSYRGEREFWPSHRTSERRARDHHGLRWISSLDSMTPLGEIASKRRTLPSFCERSGFRAGDRAILPQWTNSNAELFFRWRLWVPPLWGKCHPRRSPGLP